MAPDKSAHLPVPTQAIQDHGTQNPQFQRPGIFLTWNHIRACQAPYLPYAEKAGNGDPRVVESSSELSRSQLTICYVNAMMRLFQAVKKWYRGKHIPYTLQEMMDLQRDRYDEPKMEGLPERYQPPFVAKMLNAIGAFWQIHWKWLLGFAATVAGLILGYLSL